MIKRKLKRQLSLVQLVMLGTIGTLGAQIFVLTGEAAAIAGPATLLALLVAGLLTYSIAINYCELATSFPECGGTMAYTREAFGAGVLHYMVGSVDCLSSAFMASLSAVAFGYSLNILIPSVPIVPAAIAIIAIFTVLNILGVGMVGKVQVGLGIVQLAIFGIYIVMGFTSPNGFHWSTLVPDGEFFIYPDFWTNFAKMLRTIALIYIAYVGFEVIADDAEEAKDPDRTLPKAILISLTAVIIINMLMASVALGTLPWQQLAGSNTVLTDTVARFIPGWGVPLMALCGVETMLTTINSTMLSATREAFTLSRDGVWPKVFSRLSRRRTPYAAIVLVGIVAALVAATGLVDFLSYISSSGYMFVLFVASLAMIRLRKKYPNLRRPVKVPFFPLTPILAAGTGLLIVVFTETRALLFGAGLLAGLAVLHYAGPPISKWVQSRTRSAKPEENLILVAASNPSTTRSLVHLGSIIAQASADAYICVMSVATSDKPGVITLRSPSTGQLQLAENTQWNQITADAARRNIALYTKMRTALSVSEGILDEAASHRNTKLLIVGWPGSLSGRTLAENPTKQVLQKAHTNVAVLLDRGLGEPKRILVPVGGGIHSRMALHLANEIAISDHAQVTALRLLTGPVAADEAEEAEDQTALLAGIIEEALGGVPTSFSLEVVQAPSVQEGIVKAAGESDYDLMVLGSSEEWSLDTRLVGTVDDSIADKVPCSILFCRRYEPVTIAWLRYRVKVMGEPYNPK